MIGDIYSWCGIKGPENTESSTGKTDRFKYLKEEINDLCNVFRLTDDDIIAVKFDKGAVYFREDNNSVHGQIGVSGMFLTGSRCTGMFLDPVSGFTLATSGIGTGSGIFVGTHGPQNNPIFLILGGNNQGDCFGSSRQPIEDAKATYLSKKELFEELDLYND